MTDWGFHLALACFKIGVTAAGVEHRRRAGAAFGPGFDSAGESVPRYFPLGLPALSSGTAIR